jgi:hypothetical protein
MPSIEKACIFITSTGRTGTQFFGRFLPTLLEGCTAYHEPDVLWLTRPQHWYRKIRDFGLYRMTLGKWNPRTSLRTLNVARHRGRVSDRLAVEWLREQRGDFIQRTHSPVFLEANAAFSSLIDLLPLAFPNTRIVFLIRDPRDWIRSFMNFRSGFYGPGDLRQWLPNGRLKAGTLAGDEYQGQWRKMSRFERLCWLWNRENTYALACAERTESARVYRFEDLFTGVTREERFREMLGFISDFPVGFRAQWGFDPGIYSNRVHSRSIGPFPGWPSWDRRHVETMHVHCGGLMRRFQYGTEQEWRNRIEQAGEP